MKTIYCIIVVSIASLFAVEKICHPPHKGESFSVTTEDQEKGVDFLEEMLQWQKENNFPHVSTQQEGDERIRKFREYRKNKHVVDQSVR